MKLSTFWFKFLHRDWLDSESIVNMPMAAEGLYCRCLALQAHLGNIPADLTKLALMLRRPEAEVRANWDSVKGMFTPETVGDEPRLFNQKQRDIIRECQESHEKHVKAGKKRGRYAKDMLQHISSASSARASISNSISISDSVSKDEKVQDFGGPNPEPEKPPAHAPKKKPAKPFSYVKGPHAESFFRFWESYPDDSAPAKAFEAWNSLAPTPELVEIILADIAERKRSDPKWKNNYIKNPTTYIHAHDWDGKVSKAPANRGGYNPNQPGFIKSNPTPATPEQLAEVEALQKEMQY
jgi:hypothetical protein